MSNLAVRRERLIRTSYCHIQYVRTFPTLSTATARPARVAAEGHRNENDTSMRVPGVGQKSQFPKTAFFNVVFYRVPAIRRGYEHDTYPLRSYAFQAVAASRLTNEAAQGPSLREKLEEMSDAGADDDDDGNGAHASNTSEEVAPALPPPQLPEWKANALPSPESYSSGSVSDSSSVGSTFENNFRDIINERQAEECAIIESIVEDYTLEADAAEAEVVDTNTIVSENIICQWKSREVIAPDGTKHDKQSLLKSIYLPDGMVIASSINPVSMDRNSRVQGKSRHGKASKDEGTSVTRSFYLAKGYNPQASFEDTQEGTDVFMFDDALVLLIKAKEVPNLPPITRLAIGRAKAFGRLGEHAKESSMPIEDNSKYHVTVAVEECAEVLSFDGKAGFQVTGRTLVLLAKVPATSVIFTKPRMEIFRSSCEHNAAHDEATLFEDENEPFYARVFLLEELQVIFEMLTADRDMIAPFSAGNCLIPVLKSDGKNLFIINTALEQENLPVCELCDPKATIGRPGLESSIIERLLRNHMARHILEGKGWGGDIVPAEPCGWCGGGECSVQIIGSTKTAKVQVECRRFHNLNLPRFSLAMAQKNTAKFPSTNHPLQCPGGCKSIIWSYNITQHLLHSSICSGRISVESESIKPHLPFLDELDLQILKKNTERQRLRSLFKINVSNNHC